MKFSDKDLQQLKLPLLWLVATVTLFLMLIFVMLYYVDNLNQKINAQEQQLNQARQRLQTSGLEKDTIVQYLPKYQQLLESGFIGEERRIDWVDALRNIHMQQKLYAIDYTIGMQSAYTPSFIATLGTFTMHRSLMNVKLELLHEEDILRLLDDLKTVQSTPFLVRDCELMRLSNSVVNKLNPNLHGQCNIEWLTLREHILEGANP